MAKTKGSKRGPQQHDRKVRRVAEAARARGRKDVRADLPGFKSPSTIAGKRPDVKWKKPGGGTAIREVDPPGRLTPRDKRQDKAFRDYAKKRSGTDYQRLKY